MSSERAYIASLPMVARPYTVMISPKIENISPIGNLISNMIVVF
jgi:hypothetical protein